MRQLLMPQPRCRADRNYPAATVPALVACLALAGNTVSAQPTEATRAALPSCSTALQPVAARIEACLAALTGGYADRMAAASVLGALGRTAVPALRTCIDAMRDDLRTAMCARALWLTRTSDGSTLLLELTRRAALGPETRSELALAIADLRLVAALPALEAWLHEADEPSQASAALALFALAPERWLSLAPPLQLRIAMALADRGYNDQALRTSAAFLAQAPQLARVLIRALPEGAAPTRRILFLLSRIGSPALAPEVAAFFGSSGDPASVAALPLLGQWSSPLAVATLRTRTASPSQELAAEAARYLGTLAAAGNLEASTTLLELWRGNTNATTRCALGPAMVRNGVLPPAVELAALLDSPCRHDMTIVWASTEPRLIDELTMWLAAHPSDVARDNVVTALAWQCAHRAKVAACRPARRWLKDIARPTHPD